MAGLGDRSRDRLSVLLLCDDRPSHAPNVLEHIAAFRRYSRHRVDLFNPRGLARSRFLRLDDYDVLVVHYTIVLYLSEWFQEQIAGFGGLKVQFLQDEYRRVDATSARMRELGIDVLFSCVPADAVPSVYGSRLPGVDILPTLTGYVPTDLADRPRQPLEGRPLDVVYRGRSIPYWLGRLAQDKLLIGREFLARASSTNLRCDISWTEADRVYGEAWYRFLGSSRTTLGTESGASIVDFDGSLQERTDEYLAVNPSATFEEVEREILAPFEGNAVIEAVSPRVFEAAALGTAMVSFPGRYSDVIEPWVHYIPLEKDFSNFEDVVSAIRDDAVIEGLAARVHADLVASSRYSLQTFVREFDLEIEARVGPLRRRPQPGVVGQLSRTLRTLEPFSSRSRLAELSAIDSLRTRAVKRAVSRLVQRFPEIETLERAELHGPQGKRVQHDLERLAAAAAAHLRELRFLGRPFDVRVELDDHDRRLTLVGTREHAQDPSERREIGNRVAAAIRDGRLEEIVWNNSAVGSLTFLTFAVASLDIGYHVTASTHRFTALIEVARRNPEGLISALEPLFRPRPDAPVHELDQRAVALILMLWFTPRQSTERTMAALRAALTWKELRLLLRTYLASPEARAEVPLDLLLKDFFRLTLVGQFRTSLELDADRNALIYRTDASGSQGGVSLDPAAVQALELIVWDHSAVGSLARSNRRPRVSATLEGGVYEFQALTLVARRFPQVATPALRRAATSDVPVPGPQAATTRR